MLENLNRCNQRKKYKIRISQRTYDKITKAYKEKYILVKIIPEQKAKQIMTLINKDESKKAWYNRLKVLMS